MKKLLCLVRLLIPMVKGVPGNIAEKWEEMSQASVGVVNERRRKAVPDEARFQDRIVGPSVRRYGDSLNPDFVSRKGLTAQEISNRQTDNLGRSFKKYDDNLNYAYETVDGIPGKRVKERIKASRAHYDKGAGEKVLPFSGSRVYGPSVMTIVPEWLTKDPLVISKIRASDSMQGEPILICRLELRSSLRAALASRLQQAGTTIVDSKYDSPEIKRQNDITNRLVQGLVDPDLGLAEFATEGDSYVNYLVEEGLLYLEIKVTKT